MSDLKLSRREFIRNTSIAAGAAVAAPLIERARAAEDAAVRKTLCYNPEMEYRRLGRTDLWVSAVCLGGHWKRVNVMNQDFDQNRLEVVNRCMEAGINWIDACCWNEVMAYNRALEGRRDKMFMALSYDAKEVRRPEYRTKEKLLAGFDELMQASKQEYTDLWRITCYEPGGNHDFNTSCELVAALEEAKKQGKARFIGISSHDRRWLKMMVEYFPQLDVALFPYTAMSKQLPEDSLFDTLKTRDVGAFGIKPFASNSLFAGSSAPGDPNADEDDRRARLAIRYILCNPALTAPIPGLISPRQVDNMAKAVRERRTLDVAEQAELERIGAEALARLPEHYQWLKDWQYV